MSVENELIIEMLEDALWELFTQELSMPFIFESQAGERPTGLYGTLNLISGPNYAGHDDERLEQGGSTGLKVKTTGQRGFTLSVNMYRGGSRSKMATLQALCESRRFREKLKFIAIERGIKLGIIDAISSQDLTDLLQSEYEERAQMDISLRTVSSITEEIELIDTVEAQADIEDVVGQKVDEGILNVSNP